MIDCACDQAFNHGGMSRARGFPRICPFTEHMHRVAWFDGWDCADEQFRQRQLEAIYA